MKKFLVLWPSWSEEQVYELRFAEKFCLEKAKEYSGACIRLYEKDARLRDFVGFLDGFEAVLVVSYPLVVISPSAFKLLAREVEEGSICAPVYNESGVPEQIAQLPCSYVDTFSFCEVAELMEKNREKLEVGALDPSCFCISVADALRHLDVRVVDIPHIESLRKYVLGGALVHCFRNVFSSQREDLLGLIPEDTQTLLDVGCAEGGFGKLLRSRFSGITLHGVEASSELAERAGVVYDRIFVGRFEDLKLPKNFYDVVHMGDVLEHLYDPWEVVAKVRKLLKPGGCFTGSVPNAAHWSIVRQLLRGRFEYIPVGLLCVSHIRFFTEDSLKRLLEECGFSVEHIERQVIPPTPEGEEFISKLVALGLGSERDLKTSELLFRARKR